jgi:hypothetical protein
MGKQQKVLSNMPVVEIRCNKNNLNEDKERE